MPAEVKCSVDSCVYMQGMKCVADNIKVSMNGSEKACSPDGTYCETFKTAEC
jgi:hypothetical protein